MLGDQPFYIKGKLHQLGVGARSTGICYPDPVGGKPIIITWFIKIVLNVGHVRENSKVRVPNGGYLWHLI